MRVIRKDKTEVDLKIPLNMSKIDIKDSDCFGKEWDISSKECPQCADKDICSILFRHELEKNAEQIKSELGLNHFLDETDFKNLTHSKLKDFIVSGKTTVAELKDFVAKEAKTDDDVAVVNYIKNFIKSTKEVYTKSGVVWVR